MAPTEAVSLFLTYGYSRSVWRVGHYAPNYAQDTKHHAILQLPCQCSNQSNNKLSRHLVDTLTSYCQPLFFQIFQNIFLFLLQTFKCISTDLATFCNFLNLMMGTISYLFLLEKTTSFFLHVLVVFFTSSLSYCFELLPAFLGLFLQ